MNEELYTEYGDHYYEWNYEDYNSSDSYIFYDDNYTTDSRVSPEIYQFIVERYIVTVVFIIIFIIGVVGNSIVIYIVVKRREMRKVTNIYLANLAVIDLVFLFICVPFTSIEILLMYWPFGLVVCRFKNYVQSVSLAVSVLTLTATSIDRFYAIVYAVRARNNRSLKTAITVIIIIWCVSIVIMIPRVFLFQQVTYFNIEKSRTYCVRNEDQLKHRQIDTLLMFVLLFLLPQIVLGVFHARIVKKLWTNVRPGLRQNGITLTGLKTRRKIAKILCTITVAFGVGWLPIHVVRLYEDLTGSGDMILFKNRELLALCFSFGANSVNPIIYTLISSKFRAQFVSVLRCGRINRSTHVLPQDLGVEHIPVEVVPLRLDAVAPLNDISLPQPRDQVFQKPSTSTSYPGTSSSVQTVTIDRSIQYQDDMTTVV